MPAHSMLYRFFAWYATTPVSWRRIIVAALVPVMEFVFVDPVRWALNALARIDPLLAIACLPILLIAGMLTAAALALFAYEFVTGIGNRLKTRAAGWAFLLLLFGWIFVPLHFIAQIKDPPLPAVKQPGIPRSSAPAIPAGRDAAYAPPAASSSA